jgi:hypothetical protein
LFVGDKCFESDGVVLCFLEDGEPRYFLKRFSICGFETVTEAF